MKEKKSQKNLMKEKISQNLLDMSHSSIFIHEYINLLKLCSKKEGGGMKENNGGSESN
jgi:hypothetical protein